MNWEARAKELQKQVDELEFRVENLESALNDQGGIYFAGLTATEEKVAQLLRKRSPAVVTKQQVMDLLYAFRSDGEQPEIKIVDVYICKIRPKLTAVGINVETAWGRGYFMPAASAQAWDQAAGKAEA
jgi:DNA-binding response OmpR family regulator